MESFMDRRKILFVLVLIFLLILLLWYPQAQCVDPDHDGYGVGKDCRGSDCLDDSKNPASSSVHPSAPEICGVDLDNDCSGGDLSCSEEGTMCSSQTQQVCTESCEWCVSCQGKKYSGGKDRCVPKGKCSYACKRGYCEAECDVRNGWIDHSCPAACADEKMILPSVAITNSCTPDCRATKETCSDRSPQSCGETLCDTQKHVTGQCANRCESDACVPCVPICACASGYFDNDQKTETGCEYRCDISNNGIEQCDQRDNDCNAEIDDSVSFCQCTGGKQPLPEACNGIDDDCNTEIDNQASCSNGFDCVAGACRPKCTLFCGIGKQYFYDPKTGGSCVPKCVGLSCGNCCASGLTSGTDGICTCNPIPDGVCPCSALKAGGEQNCLCENPTHVEHDPDCVPTQGAISVDIPGENIIITEKLVFYKGIPAKIKIVTWATK